jgi:hypothetical protein
MLDFDIPSMPDHAEARRLLAIAEECRSEENAVANALTHPPQSLVYSEYQRLSEVLKAKRLKSHQSRIALRAHQHKMRNEPLTK